MLFSVRSDIAVPFEFGLKLRWQRVFPFWMVTVAIVQSFIMSASIIHVSIGIFSLIWNMFHNLGFHFFSQHVSVPPYINIPCFDFQLAWWAHMHSPPSAFLFRWLIFPNIDCSIFLYFPPSLSSLLPLSCSRWRNRELVTDVNRSWKLNSSNYCFQNVLWWIKEWTSRKCIINESSVCKKNLI